jgi:flagellin-like protein
MDFRRRSAVSPVIATLLLIAIAVAASIIVYVYVNSLSGGLTAGGGQQVSQQVQLQAYSFSTAGVGSGQYASIFLKNVGTSSITIGSVYVDGNQLTEWGAGTYTRYLLVPSGTASCFAAVPTTATVAINQAATGATVTGTASACTTTGATCTATNFCLDTTSVQTETLTLAAQSTNQILIGLNQAVTSGTSHTIKIITASGGQAVFSITAGRTG